MNNQDNPNSAISGSRFNYGYIVVIASFVIFLINVGMFISIGVFFKPILNDFGWSRAVTSAPLAISSLMTGLGSIITGMLTDRFGSRIVVTACAIISGTGYLLMSQVTSIWEIYLYYGILIGAGTSCTVSMISTVSRWFTTKRTVMVGIISAGGGVGGLIMPLLANWLISIYTWPRTYLFMGIAYLAIILIAAQFLRKSPLPAVLHTGIKKVRDARSVQTPLSLSFKEVLRTRQYWIVLCLFFGFGFTAVTMQFHIVNHATDINISSTSAAGLLSLINGLSVLGSIGLGAVGDRFGNKQTVIYTFFALAATLIWLVFIGDLWSLNLFSIIFGLAFGSALANLPTIISRLFGTASVGLLIGVTTLCQTIGGSLGGFLAGYIFDVFKSYNLAFIICASLCAVMTLATSILKPVRQLNSEDTVSNITEEVKI
jgi:OFA family oxalate/formate antiporter-like MFS transporter